MSVANYAASDQTLVVIEEWRPFIETQLRAAVQKLGMPLESSSTHL